MNCLHFCPLYAISILFYHKAINFEDESDFEGDSEESSFVSIDSVDDGSSKLINHDSTIVEEKSKLRNVLVAEEYEKKEEGIMSILDIITSFNVDSQSLSGDLNGLSKKDIKLDLVSLCYQNTFELSGYPPK